MDAEEVKALLKKVGVRADRHLGQHFLLDDDIAERSVSYANIGKDETVLEIGPGLGMLTRFIAARAKRVVAVEKESMFLGLVDEPNVEYVHGDALKVDLPPFDKVVSNLPYSISSPITFRLLELGGFRTAVLMYQKEFAERLASGPGSKVYSRLSVSTYVVARVDLLDKVSKGSFYPVPKVDSCIVRMTPREPPFGTKDWEVYHKVVKMAFSQRRKKLRNSLRNGIRDLGLKDTGRVELEKMPYGDERPERLTPEQFAEVTDFLYGP